MEKDDGYRERERERESKQRESAKSCDRVELRASREIEQATNSNQINRSIEKRQIELLTERARNRCESYEPKYVLSILRVECAKYQKIENKDKGGQKDKRRSKLFDLS
jgi:hypothetical protein